MAMDWRDPYSGFQNSMAQQSDPSFQRRMAEIQQMMLAQQAIGQQQRPSQPKEPEPNKVILLLAAP